MISIQNRITAFAKLGDFLSQYAIESIKKNDRIEHNEIFFDGFLHQIQLAQEKNSWFTKENILFTLESWSNTLTKSNLKAYTAPYDCNSSSSKKVAIVMAGNIPLVGFHDFLSVLIYGHSVLVKQSSRDKHLLPFLAKYLEHVEEDFKGKITFTEEKLIDYDAIIATGSDNTARYFEYYFKNKPNIIRKNRNSVAVLTGNETKDDFIKLSDDIFQYFGLGCRSVSKLYIPKGFNFNLFFKGMYSKKEHINNAKYANNYDYNKAVYLMSEFELLENGFLMIKEDASYSSPIATIFYEFYDTESDLKIKLDHDKEKIQCIVANGFIENEVAFGQTQHPKLTDFADGINTLEFLNQL